MRWSKLRKRTLDNINPSIRDRVDFHVTSYRGSHDSEYGRAWVSVDGRQIASWSCFEALWEPGVPLEEVMQYNNRHPIYERRTAEAGVYSKLSFVEILEDYLNCKPHLQLSSAVPLMRALAVADRRVGRRSLGQYPINDEDDPLVKLFFALRNEADRD